MKPSKPEDPEESWLRKMAGRLPRRRDVSEIKESDVEPQDEYEDEDDTSGEVAVGDVSKPRKKRKKKNPKAKEESSMGCFIILIAIADAVWFLFFN